MKSAKAMKHQVASIKFMSGKPAVFDMSDPGTGKTFVEIEDFVSRRKKKGECALVLGTKSILTAAWANDIRKFAPHLKVSVAYASNRKEAMAKDADIYVTNHDAVKDLLKYPASFWKKFDTIIIDESTAFKHHTSQRSKAISKLAKHFKYRRCMSGTPTSNGICDIWHQVFILDGGKRLGGSFFGFRSACCIPTQTGPSTQHLKWEDKPGIEDAVISLISDITIRHRFEDCVDIPENHKYSIATELSPKHRKIYDQLEDDSLAFIGKTSVTAINGAVLATKLLQAASGAVYNDDGRYSPIATDRYELVLDLVEEREHTVVFYQWEHQLAELLKVAEGRKIEHVVWDPNKPHIADDFQAGKYQTLFAHPASAGHGITLTKGTATIWASPTYNLEHFLQGLKRIHRIGQKEKTETIVVIAENTIDEKVWDALQNKKVRMDALFQALKDSE